MRAVANVPAPGNPNAPDAIEEAEKETFATKVAKFIPGEVTAVYAALAIGAAAASKSLSETDPPTWPLWIAFVVGVAASPLYWYIERQSSERRKKEAGEPIPRVIMRFPSLAARDEAVSGLFGGDPPIAVVLNDPTSIAFSPHLLLPGEAEVVEQTVARKLLKPVQV